MTFLDEKRKSDVGSFLAAILVGIMFSADRNPLITHYVIGKQNASMLTIGTILIAGGFYILLVLQQSRLHIPTGQKRLVFCSLLLASYFLFHELFFGDSLVSVKYSIFLGIICLYISSNYNFFYVYKVLGYVGGLISGIIIFQQILLLAFAGGDPSQFEISIPGTDYNRWLGCNFVTPFGLGMFEVCSGPGSLSIFGINYDRSLFFTTEPKYISSILLVTFGSLLISKSKSVLKYGCLLAHLLAFALIASAAAIFVIIVSFLMLHSRYIGAFIYCTLVFLAPMFLFPVIFELLLHLGGVEGYLLGRISSGATSTGAGGMVDWSLLGESLGSCADIACRRSRGLLGNLYGTYGVLGFFIFWLFLFCVISPVFEMVKSKKLQKKIGINFGLLILVNTYVIFNLYFFGDLLNMFGLFIIASLILLPKYMSRI